jgi:Outer membrane protein beta-barrel domain
MLKMSRSIAVALIAVGLCSVAAAQGFDNRRLFFGGGLARSSISNFDDATGFQVFGGYNFPAIARNFYVDAEAGYMDTGKFKRTAPTIETKAKGPWTTGVARYMVAPQWEVFGRAGYDFGDDDGVMVGVGGGYIVNKNLKLRVEYVSRDTVDSFQFNVVFYPW